MAFSYQEEVSDGVRTLYPVSLQYVNPSDIYVYVGDHSGYMNQLDWRWANGQVELTNLAQVPKGTKFYIRRIMTRSSLVHEFANKGIRGKSVDEENWHALLLLQELMDGFTTQDGNVLVQGDLDMLGNRVINLGKPKSPTDALRLADFMIGAGASPGVTFRGSAYMRTDQYLNEPGVVESYTFDIKFFANPAGARRTIMGDSSSAATKRSWIQFNHDLTEAYIRDVSGGEQKVIISSLGMEMDKDYRLTVSVRQGTTEEFSQLRFQLSSGLTTPWSEQVEITNHFDQFFGSGDTSMPSNVEIRGMQLQHGTTVWDWNFLNVDPIGVVPCINPAMNGQLYGEWTRIEGGSDGLEVKIASGAVTFEVQGTQFNRSSTNVDAVLREIDAKFMRKQTTSAENPSPPSGTQMQPNTFWLIDSADGAKWRPLPEEQHGLVAGDRVVVRDSDGMCSTNNARLVAGDGVTIEGIAADLLITTDWAWCELVYIGDGKWEVIEGGVGAEIRLSTESILDAVYPPGSVYVSTSAINPAVLFKVGVWERVAQGRVLVGVGSSVGADGRQLTIGAGQQLGSVATKLTESHIPRHRHATPGSISDQEGPTTPIDVHSGSSPSGGRQENTDEWGAADPTPVTAVQPSLGVYIWERKL